METLTRSNGSSGPVASDAAAMAKLAPHTFEERPGFFVSTTPEMAAARRKLTAAIELLNSFDPTADQLTEAARALVKIAHKGMRGE